MLGYYLPGIDDWGVDDIVIIFAVPTALMAAPFLLIAILLRVKVVWIFFGSIMLLQIGVAAVDVMRADQEDPSLMVFLGTFFVNMTLLFFALLIDLAIRGGRLAIRGGRKAHRSLSSRASRDSGPGAELPESPIRNGDGSPES